MTETWKEIIDEAITSRHALMGYRGGEYVKVGEKGILVFELRTATGYSNGNPQSIDAFHLEDLPSKGMERTSYEIKVSRNDFQRELKLPNKRRAAMMFSNRFYFVAPAGIILPEYIPYDCGLIEVGEDKEPLVTVKAPWRDSAAPTWMLLAAVARRMKKV